MIKKPKVYIASAYTLGDKVANVNVQIHAADRLMNEGYMPFAPLLSHYHDMECPRDYESWMEYCFAWLEDCDYLVRLPGESSGADREDEYARKLGIPVYYSIEELLKATNN